MKNKADIETIFHQALAPSLVLLLAASAVAASDAIHFGPVGTYYTPGNTWGVTVSDGYAYVAAGNAGLVVFDVSNPAIPQPHVATVDTIEDAIQVAVQDHYAYVVAGSAGLQIFDIVNPESPQRVGGLNTSGYFRKVVVAGEYAYMAGDGLVIANVSDPVQVHQVGWYATTQYCYDLTLSGDYVYLALEMGGLQVIDVSNPNRPQSVGTSHVGTVTTVAVSGNYAYVGGYVEGHGLQAIDLSEPRSPKPVGRPVGFAGAVSAVVRGAYLYAACGERGLQVFSLRDPAQPAQVQDGGYTGPARALAFAESGDYLYVATGSPTLQVLSLSPAAIFSPSTSSVHEDDPTVTLTVYRGSPGGEDAFDVDYWTEDAGATAGVDYLGSIGFLHFAFGQSSKAIEIPLLNDSIREDPQSFRVHLGILSNGVPVKLFANAEVSIVDNDPGIHFDQMSYAFREVAGEATVTVLRGNDFELPPVSVEFATSDGTALVGEDYVAASGTLTFAAGEDQKTLRIQIVNDDVPEPRESFDLVLSNPTEGVHLRRPDRCTIAIDVDDARVLLNQVGMLPRQEGVRLLDAWGVAVQDDYAYVGDGSALRIIDVWNPQDPVEVGHFDTGGNSYHPAVSGSYVCVEGPRTNLLIIDISDPRNPQEVGSWDAATNLLSIALQGDYAYVADGRAGLQILDLSDPTEPRRVGGVSLPGSATAVAVEGNYAYVGTDTGLKVIDISDPSQPEWLAETAGITIGQVAVSGTFVYHATTNGLTILNVSDPNQPQRIGNVDLDLGPYFGDLAVSGSHAYVAKGWGDGPGGLAVIDVSDPAQPLLVANYGTQYDAWGVAVTGQYAFVTDLAGPDLSGLYVLDVSTPSNPKTLSSPPFGGGGSGGGSGGVALAGEYAYVTHNWYGRTDVIDVSDPSNPVVAGTLAPSNIYTGGGGVPWCRSLVQRGTVAFASLDIGLGPFEGGYFTSMDLSDPVNPKVLADFDSYPVDFALSGNFAYLVTYASFLQVLDISDPANLSAIGGLEVDIGNGYDNTIAVQDGHAYVAGDQRLQVVDVSDPVNPQLVGTYTNTNNWGYTLNLAVAESYAYVLTKSGLQVIDISVPTQPMPVASYSTRGDASSVMFSGDYAFVGGSDGLEVIDISHPTRPQWAGGYPIPNVGWLAVSGQEVYLAAEGRLLILRATEVPAFDDVLNGASEITLRWNGAAEGMTLQRATSVTSPVWQDVAGSDMTNTMTLPIGGVPEFFRLFKAD